MYRNPRPMNVLQIMVMDKVQLGSPDLRRITKIHRNGPLAWFDFADGSTSPVVDTETELYAAQYC